MRLLDVHQLKLKEFFDEKPPYAILSHTWGDGEVSLQDLPTPAATSMAGYAKIKKCCELAIQDGFEYVWIDTCCIDKTSSSELSEAINSMYHWYQSATVCYAYLSDVGNELSGNYDDARDDPCFAFINQPKDPKFHFTHSRWFTRGWTLQELLAPDTIIFYNRGWTEIGTKCSLQEEISQITGIPCQILSNAPIGEISIAQRMSWASKRNTTRVEDIAYCLMGIFGVNMPTLYGEGRRAFIRLQHEIMKISDDHSLFAWASQKGSDDHSLFKLEPPLLSTNSEDDTRLEHVAAEAKWGPDSGLLAVSPKQFQHSQGVRRLQVVGSQHPFSMTNNGLHIWLPMVQVSIENQEIYRVILNCDILAGTGPLSIYLKRYPSGQYSRILTGIVRINKVEYDPEPVELYVKEGYPEGPYLPRSNGFAVQFYLLESPSAEQGYKLLGFGPGTLTDKKFQLHVSDHFLQHRAISYIVVGANNDRTARAMVILGVSLEYKNKVFCVIRSEPMEIDETWVKLRHIHTNNIVPTLQDFDEIFGGVRLDRITKQLGSGHIISVAVRVSPNHEYSKNSGKSFIRQTYRLMITFTPPNRLYSTPVNPPSVAPLPAVRLPMLTVHRVYGPDLSNFSSWRRYPTSDWSLGNFTDMSLLWIPTEGSESALLGLSEKLISPLLRFHIVDSDIAFEFIHAPSDSGLPQATWDDVLLSYLDGGGPTQKRYRLPDFPLTVKTATETIRVSLRPRMSLSEEGYQMLVSIKGVELKRQTIRSRRRNQSQPKSTSFTVTTASGVCDSVSISD